MKLTKLLLEYPGVFTPAPDDEVERNKEDWEERQSVAGIINNYIKNGSKGYLDIVDFDDGYPSTDITEITSLPDNLRVNGNFYMMLAFSLLHLPRNLFVEESLIMTSCGVTAIPDDLKVGMNIEASECHNLRHIPENFTVNGDLLLDDCPKVILPKGLKVAGTLCIGSRIKLPTDLDVGRLKIA